MTICEHVDVDLDLHNVRIYQGFDALLQIMIAYVERGAIVHLSGNTKILFYSYQLLLTHGY